MTNPESFLSRWSRRKHEAAGPGDAQAAPSPAAPAETIGSEAAAAVETSNDDCPALPGGASDVVVPPFDPASVPSIESIAADTDIRAFLAPGAPLELTRAALRRAWVTDPKIRDFVGLADYDWDFNAPGSMAGFGTLEMTDELRRAAAEIIGPAPRVVASGGTVERQDLTGHGPASDGGDVGRIAQNVAAEQHRDPRERDDTACLNADGTTSQDEPHATEKSQLVVRPRHGGALPK
jgi:hypothetical protein